MLALVGLRIKYGSKTFASMICTQSLHMDVTRTVVSYLASFPPSNEQLTSYLLISICFYPTEALVLCRTAIFKLWSMRVE